MGQVTAENVLDVLSHHAPDTGDLARIANIRQAAHVFAEAILVNAPPCADASAAIRHVREAMFTANAAIALKGKI